MQPHNTITSIDHPVIAVESLVAARGVYERLGFRVPPRGSHVEWGTGNLCVMFARDYLELRGIIDPSRFTLGLEAHLEAHGEGMMGLAFGTTGADHAYAQMRAAGLDPQPVKALTRNFELPGGWVQPRFRLCFPDRADVEGLMHVVLCEHLTPELIRRPGDLVHPNGATGVAGIVGVIEDFDRIETIQRRLLGDDAVRRERDTITLTVPSRQTVELVSPASFDSRFGRYWREPDRVRSVLPVLRLWVADNDATVRHLEGAGVPYWRHQGNVLVGPRETCGVLMQFEPVPERSAP